jgi:hypothetical protein
MQAETFTGLPAAYVEVAEVDILREESIAHAKCWRSPALRGTPLHPRHLSQI